MSVTAESIVWGRRGRQYRVEPAWRCVPGTPCCPGCPGKGAHGNAGERWMLSVYENVNNSMDGWVTLLFNTGKGPGPSEGDTPPSGGSLDFYGVYPKIEDKDDLIDVLAGRSKSIDTWMTETPLYLWKSTGLGAGEMVEAAFREIVTRKFITMRDIFHPGMPAFEPVWQALEIAAETWNPKILYKTHLTEIRLVQSYVEGVVKKVGVE